MRKCNCRCQRNNTCRYQNYNMNSYNMYSNSNMNCNCMNSTTETNSNPFPSNYLFGHAYTPNQELGNTFNPEIGLENGSMFPELVSPYYPGQSMEFIEYLKTVDRNGGCS